MHRIIDAKNVIGSRPDGWWGDRGQPVKRLVGRLDRWAACGEERVTVMLEREPREALRAERVEIAWASAAGADAADREIVARLPGWLAEDDVVVVTSATNPTADEGTVLGCQGPIVDALRPMASVPVTGGKPTVLNKTTYSPSWSGLPSAGTIPC